MIKIKKLKVLTTIATEIVLITFLPIKLKDKNVYFFKPGTQNIVETTDNFNLHLPKSFRKNLEETNNYYIEDYDYCRDNFHEREVILYKNKKDIVTANKNDFFYEPNNNIGIYKAHTHKIVECKVNFFPFPKKNFVKFLSAPPGYTIKKYSYDINNCYTYETILYENNSDVKVIDKDNFGKAVVSKKEDADYYKIGELKIAKIITGNDFLFNDKKLTIKTNGLFKIIDYDYNRTGNTYTETFLYQNMVNINKKTLLPENFDSKNNNLYLIYIDKKLRKDTYEKQYIKNIDNYELIGYSADYNKFFEYDTKVFIK